MVLLFTAWICSYHKQVATTVTAVGNVEDRGGWKINGKEQGSPFFEKLKKSIPASQP